MTKKSKTIGILGGGQLARMMLLEAHRLGMSCSVMSADSDDPAAQVTSSWTKGDIDNLNEVIAFSESVDVLTFESEFIKPEILETLAEKNIETAPSALHMRMIQDRLSQKELLEKYDIPTSSFYKVNQFEDIENLKSNIDLPLVIKARLGGYDGKGTYILKDWDGESASDCRRFLEGCSDGAIAEHFIPFKRELAVSLARSANGDLSVFPLVESFQEECRCLWVKGPIDHHLSQKVVEQIQNLLNEENYIGFISFELFESEQGLLVNEIAPRVHNSAHYSQNGLSIDQFSCHLKAVVGESLPQPEVLTGGFAMYNLIGSGNGEPQLKTGRDVFLHWYGKKENRAGRKMGHLNTFAESPEAALEKLKKVREEISL